MSHVALWVALGLGGFGLPVALLGWATAIFAFGQLRSTPDQPAELRFIAVLARSFVRGFASRQTPDVLALFSALIYAGTANLLAVLAIRNWWYDPSAMLVVAGYFVIELLWLVRIRRAIIRSHANRDIQPPN